MSNINKTFLFMTLTLLTTGCCMTDYSSTIRKVADPMLVGLDKFYKTHKRHPNTQERDALLLKAGCEKVVGNVCFRGGDEILVKESRATPYNTYNMRIDYKKTLCTFGLTSKGEKRQVDCNTQACIQWNH